MHIHIHVYIYIYVRVNLCFSFCQVRFEARQDVFRSSSQTVIYINKCMCACMYMYIYVHTLIYICVHIYKSVRVNLFFFLSFRSVLKLAKMFLDPLDNELCT